MEIRKENNILIAKFMGLKVSNTEDYDSSVHTNVDVDLKYHKSWDWLIPIVEKIESIGFEFNMTGKSNYVYIGDGKKNVFISDKKKQNGKCLWSGS